MNENKSFYDIKGLLTIEILRMNHYVGVTFFLENVRGYNLIVEVLVLL